MSDFQTWQIFIGIGGLAVTVALGMFGKGFRYWADQLKGITDVVDARLAKIAEDYKHQAEKAEAATKELRDEFHNMAISMERRVSRLEAQDQQRQRREDKEK